jgi:endonuclease III
LARCAEIVDRLVRFYGPLAPPPADPFAFYLWQVLGTRTTGGRRDAALIALRRVPALTPESLRKLARGRLETIVRQSGPYLDERLAAIDAGIAVFTRQPRFVERLRHPLREAWLAARDLPHLGHAGALGLLMFAGNSRVVPVDADLARVAVRLGLSAARPHLRREVRDVRRALAAWLPGDLPARRMAVQYLRHHAEHACVASRPHCRVCPIAAMCPASSAAPSST